ncbi:hypothetical protein C2U55_08645 [Enterobacteriaceae bacterium ENNIH3]|uniref:Uncharacterized protein n=1 Tax=virus sp. ct6zJ3 TaxID=2826792 RepID=A0A8S5R8C4_9VIRU|nr:hypothetical protein C2U55_08645 [Enterobacteriaceae bacterium ENNIH3]DAE27640.1 MAG TPA: hypothetical protein [virus sp. ct6zJ3]
MQRVVIYYHCEAQLRSTDGETQEEKFGRDAPDAIAEPGLVQTEPPIQQLNVPHTQAIASH